MVLGLVGCIPACHARRRNQGGGEVSNGLGLLTFGGPDMSFNVPINQKAPRA
jgi:hypothetical protein